MQINDLFLEQFPVSTRRMRVALITETYPPEINGVAMTIGLMVKALQSQDHQVQLIRPRQHEETPQSPEDNLEQVLRPGIPLPRYAGLNMGLPAKRLLSKLWTLHRPDLVHIATEGPLGWSAMAAANKLRLPVVAGFHTNFHTYSSHYGFGWLRKPINAYLRKFHNQARLTLVPTHSLAQELARSGFRNLEVLSRGVDSTLFSPQRRSGELRRSWGVAESSPVICYVGRIAPEKNLSLLLRAFEAFGRIRPEARLLLVGDGPELAALKTGHPHVIFAGSRTGEDLARHYASADIFFFPSLTETFGNVLLEAMASGLAVLGFDYAAAAEHVNHGVNGLKVPFSDEAAFLDQADWLARNVDARHELGRRARETTLSISWDAIFARLEELYLRVVEEKDVLRRAEFRRLGLH